MNRRRRVALRVTAVACLGVTGLLWWPASAGAEAEAVTVEVGWWYRLSGGEGAPSSSGAPGESSPPPTAPPAPVPFPTLPVPVPDEAGPPVAVPPPSEVPEGGLYVANDSLGPSAIGAARFHVGQVGETRLSLQFAEGGASGGLLPIVACPLLEGFQAVANGAWRDRPAHDCARAQALGTTGTDGSINFVLSEAFQQGGQETFDIVLLPEPGNGTPFSTPFQPVTSEALAIQGPAPARPVPTTTPSFTPNRSPVPSVDAAPRPAGSGSRPAPAAPRPGAGQAPTPAGGGGGGAAPGPAPTGGATQQVAEIFDDKPWARIVATVLLGFVAVSMAAASSDRVRTAVPALGRLAGPGGIGVGERGVGRFARSRAGRPPALS